MRYAYLTGKKEWHKPFLEDALKRQKLILKALEDMSTLEGRTLKDRAAHDKRYQRFDWNSLDWSWDMGPFDLVRTRIDKKLLDNVAAIEARLA